MITQPNMLWLESYHLPFTWSHTRDQLFHLCQRQYYWRYYAPYGGNSPEEAGDRGQYYILGRLSSIAALIGTTVHTVARDALRAARVGHPWEVAVYAAAAKELLRRSVVRSQKACQQSSLRVQRQTTLLMEHYYHQPFELAQALATVHDYTEALPSHASFLRTLVDAQNLILIDEVRHFNVGGVFVFSVPDAVTKSPEGSFRLVDWKTGNAVAENLGVARSQLALYGLYLNQVEEAQPEKIQCELANLRHGTAHQWQLASLDLEQARERVYVSSAEMKQHLRDIATNQAVHDDFPPISQADMNSGPCVWCAFKRICLGLSS